MTSYKDLSMMNQSIKWEDYTELFEGRDKNGMTKSSPP